MRGFLIILTMLLLFSQMVMANEQKQEIEQNNNKDQLVYLSLSQELSSIQSKVAVLGEKIKQQNSINEDSKKLEETYLELKFQLKELNLNLKSLEKNQENEFKIFDGRVSDLSLNINYYSILITLIAIILGLSTGYISILKAKEQAENWLTSNTDKLIKDAESKLDETNKELKVRFENIEKEQKEQHEKFIEIRNVKAKLADSLLYKYNKLDHESFKDSNLNTQDWIEIGSDYLTNKQYELSEIIWDVILNNSLDSNNDSIKANAYLSKAHCLMSLGQNEDALKTYDTLIARFNESTNDDILKQVAKGMVNKGVLHLTLNQSEDAINTFDTLIARFSDSKNDDIIIFVAMGMFNKGGTQRDLGQSEEAIKTYDTLIARFNNLEGEEIQKVVIYARDELKALQSD